MLNLCKKLKENIGSKNLIFLVTLIFLPIERLILAKSFLGRNLVNLILGCGTKSKTKPKIIENKKLNTLFFKNLHKVGYRYFNVNRRAKKDMLVVKAFQQRFNPLNITGYVDKKTFEICKFLAINRN